MKKIFVLALAATAVVACSKSENGEGAEPIPSQAQQLKVLTSINTQTRTAVDGAALPQGSVIGVHVVTGTPETSDEAVFNPTKMTGELDNYYTDGSNVRFENATGVNNWTSTDENGDTKLLLFSGSETARVYGYYPYNAALTGVGAAATVPVSILPEGTIKVGAAAPETVNPDDPDALAATAANEIDYMFDATADPDNKVGAQTTTTAKLTLKHALSRVSFRMYTAHDAKQAVSGDDQTHSKYKFVGYVIKNKSGKSGLKAKVDETTGATMKISDGTIDGTVAGGEISRTIEGYVMERAKESADDQDAADAEAADKSFRVSNLMFPHETLTATADGKKTADIEVVFMIAKVKADGTQEGDPVGYALPFAVETDKSDSWLAGKNYTYTVKFTGNALSIETVTVTEWEEVAGGNMEIE